MVGYKMLFSVVCCTGHKGNDIMVKAFVWCLVSAMLVIRMVGYSSHALLCGMWIVTFAAIINNWLVPLCSIPIGSWGWSIVQVYKYLLSS